MTTKVNNRMIDGAAVNVLDFYPSGKTVDVNDAESNRIALEEAIKYAPSGSKVVLPSVKDGALFTFWLIDKPLHFGGASIGTKAGIELVGENYTWLQAANGFDTSEYSALIVNTDINSWGININLTLKCRTPDETLRLDYAYRGTGVEKAEFGDRFFAELGLLSPIYLDSVVDVKHTGGAEQFSAEHFEMHGLCKNVRVHDLTSINMGGLVGSADLYDDSDVTFYNPHCTSYPGGIGGLQNCSVYNIVINNPNSTTAAPVVLLRKNAVLSGMHITSENAATTVALRVDADDVSYDNITSNKDLVLETSLDVTNDYNSLSNIYFTRNNASGNNLWFEVIDNSTINVRVSGNGTLRYYQNGLSRFADTSETNRTVTLTTGQNMTYNFKSGQFLTKNITSGISLYDVVVATNINGSLTIVANDLQARTTENNNAGLLFAFDKRTEERTVSGSPVGSLTPLRIGEEVLGNTGTIWYKSTGLTSSDWVALNVI